jgi:ATP-dependent Clp protease ATP-binding subunit ClpC
LFERYTEQARRVVFFARYEAAALASSSIDSEHLLLGLLREGKGDTGRILKRYGISHDSVRRQVEERRASGPLLSTSVDIPLAPEAKRALGFAQEEADRTGAAKIGTEHVLLGLLRETESPAAGILSAKGLRLAEVREELRLRSSPQGAPPRPQEAFANLADCLSRLEQANASYRVSPFGGDAIRVEVTVPDQRWVATFFADGRVTMDVLSVAGITQDDTGLEHFLDRLGPPRPRDA